MASSIRTFLPVIGDPRALVVAFENDPGAWLTDARQDTAEDRWIIPLRAGALHRTVRIGMAAAWRAGSTRWRSLWWDPIGPDGEAAAFDRLLPSFDGEIGLHVEQRERATLILDGRYQPPGGRLGSAVDTVALRKLAQATAASFVASVAAELATQAQVLGEAHNGQHV